MPRLVMAVALLLSVVAGAQEVAYEKFRLDNGLTVVLHEDHTLPRVAVNLWFHVGSKDEAPGRSGFAHLFEHLMFMGTHRVPGSRFDEVMEAGGGYNNASTGQDATNYYSSGPTNLLPTLLWLEADRLEHLGDAMTQEKLDLQREVVRNERRESYEIQPYGQAWLAINRLMYPSDHPYHHPVIGSHADLEAATLEDVKAFFDRYYVPGNASLVVAGDIDPAETRALITKYFADLPPRPLGHRGRPAPVVLDGVLTARLEDDVPADRTMLVYHSPPWYADGDAEMDLLAALLADGKNSRLYRRLVYEEKVATEVEAYQDSQALGSLFAIEVAAAPGVDLARIEAMVDEEIELLSKVGPAADELARIVAGLEMSTLTSLQSIDNVADRMNQYLFYRGEPDSFAWDLGRYRAATPEGVRSWAARVLTPARRLVLQVVDRQDRSGPTARDEPPAVGDAAPFVPQAPESFRLESGVAVHLWRREGLPLVELAAVFAGGAAGDPVGKEGLASLTGAMLDEGAGSLSALEFGAAVERLGASIGVAVGDRTSTVRLSVLKRNLSDSLALVGDAVRRPTLDPAELERLVRLRTAGLAEDLEDPATIAGRVVRRTFFGADHPLGRASTPASLAAVEPADVVGRHAAVYRPDRLTLFVAGDLTADEARAALGPIFGVWTVDGPAPAAAAIPAGPPVEGRRVYLVHEPGAVQTVVRAMHPAPVRTSPDRLGLELLATVFGGTFTSRLNANLREDKGYTYGAWAGFTQTPETGYLLVSTSVRADATGASLAEIAAEFARARSEGLTDEEAEKARRTLRTEKVERFASLGSIVGLAGELLASGAALEEPAADLIAIDGVDRASMNALAARFLDDSRGVLVLVGDRDVVAAQLEGLDLPAPIELDALGEPVE